SIRLLNSSIVEVTTMNYGLEPINFYFHLFDTQLLAKFVNSYLYINGSTINFVEKSGSDTVVRRFNKEVYMNSIAIKTIDDCVICTEQLSIREILLPCKHSDFCPACILRLYAYQEHPTCPIC